MKILALVILGVMMLLKIMPNYKAVVKYGKMGVDRYKVMREYIAGVQSRRLVLNAP